MDVQTDSERVRHVAQGRARVPGLVGRRVAGRPGRARRLDRTATWQRYGADPARYGPPAAARRRRASATPASPGHHHAAVGRRGGRDRRPAGQGRQRPLRPRLLEVHPLLQVRRGVRRGRPEHVRHRRRRPRLRRPDLDRAGRPAAGVGVRLLRQLHRRLPDRRADVQARVRHARGRHVGRVGPDRDRRRSARTAASAARSTCTSRTTRSSRSPRRSTRR